MEQLKHSYDVFVSYAGADSAWVEGYLLDALDQAGIRHHTEEAFALGVPRLIEFERAIKGSRRTLLILSPAYLAEQFSQFVDLLAQTYGLETATWPVIPLILQPVQLPPRLASLVKLEATTSETWEKIIAHLCQELQKPVPGIQPVPPCPYPGMAPFSEADSDRFFGRDQEAQEIVQQLRLHPFLAVIGPSGSGKSSLVLAGFLPLLRRSTLLGSGEWLIRLMRPGDRPLTALANALEGGLDSLPQTVPAAPTSPSDGRRALLIVDQFEEVFTLAGGEALPFQQELLRLVALPNRYLVLTVRADFYADLMACPLWGEIQQHRLEVLPMGEEGLRQAIVRPAEDAGVFVETALVERLVADAAGEPGVLPLVQETLVLLWEKVERRFLPARAYDALVLPYSAYSGAPAGLGPVTMPVTGLQVAMARRADAALAGFSVEGQTVARRILMRLVQFGEGRADTRRRQPVAALRSVGDDPDLFERVLQHLVGNRLLTSGGDDRQVDISHEALIDGWPRLRGWLNERREAEQVRRRLEGKTAEWVRLGKSGGGLLDQVELLEAERWLSSPDAIDLGYSESLSELVQASRTAIEESRREKEAAHQRELDQALALAASQRTLAEEQQRRAEEQSRSARRLRRLLAGLAVMFLVAAVAASFAFVQRSAERAARATAQFNERVAITQEAMALDAQTTAQVASTAAVSQRNVAATAQVDAESQRDEADRQRRMALDQEATAVAERNIAATARAEAETQRDEAERQRRNALSRQLAAQALNYLDERLDLALLLSLQANRLADTPEVRGSLVAALSFDPDLIAYLHGHEADVWNVAFDPDGKLLATCDAKGVIILWDVKAHQPVGKPMIGHDGGVNALAFSPDGTVLASGGDDGNVVLWDVATGEPAGLPLRRHEKSVYSLDFSPDGRWLASGSQDQTIILWNVASRQPGEPLKGHSSSVWSVAFSPDGKTLASGSSDSTVVLWNMATGKPLAPSLTGHELAVYGVAFSPDGLVLASCSRDQTVRLWDVEKRAPLDTLKGTHTDRVISVAFSPDGRTLASAGWDNLVVLWDVPTRQPRYRLEGHTYWVNSVAFSPDGQTLASGSSDDKVILWDIQGRQALGQTLMRHSAELTSLAFDPQGQVVALGGGDGAVLVWDVQARRLLVPPLSGHSQWVNSVAFSRDGRLLASSSDDKTIILWDIQTWQPVGAPITGHLDYVISAALSPDGRVLASASNDDTIILWRVETHEPLGLPLTEHTADVRSVTFGPDGQKFASGGRDNAVIVWDLASRKPLWQSRDGHTDWVNSVAFSYDGLMLASASADSKIRLWDVATGRPLGGPLAGHTDFVMDVAFSPDGQMLASAGEDKTVILWDLPTRQRIGPPLAGHRDLVSGVDFSPGGKELASVGEDGAFILWDVDFVSWKARACQKANRNLTPEEWDQFVGSDVPYEPVCPGLP